MFRITDIPRRMALAVLIFYKKVISPWIPPACRFHPTCSVYAMECFHRHPFFKALWLSLRRLSKCHPWHPGGFDFPPEPKKRGERVDEQGQNGHNPRRAHTASNAPDNGGDPIKVNQIL